MAFTWTQEEVDNFNNWNTDEDAKLTYAFSLYGPSWDSISQLLSNKSPQDCIQRWTQIQNEQQRTSKKTHWIKEEDEQLKELVQQQGENWNEIAKRMKNRTGNQVRNRYINHIKAPSPRPWNEKEDAQLLQLYNNIGPKWTQIGKIMDRSETMIKNRFYTKYKQPQQQTLQLKLDIKAPQQEQEINPRTLSACEPEINKKICVSKACQTEEVQYMCPRNVISLMESFLSMNQNQPKKCCWVAVPIIKVYNTQVKEEEQ